MYLNLWGVNLSFVIVSIFIVFVSPVFISFVPNVNWSERDIEEHKKILKDNLLVLLSFGFLIFIVSWFLLPSIINLFFGRKYMDAPSLFPRNDSQRSAKETASGKIRCYA